MMSSPQDARNMNPLSSQPDPNRPGEIAMNDLDALKRDRFELLSAYLDGEVTAEEGRQVEAWLATDPEFQSLHARLLKLQQGFQNIPTPVASQSTQKTIEQVLNRVEKRPRLMLVWTGLGAAAAAAVVGAISSVLTNGAPPMVLNGTANLQGPMVTPQAAPTLAGTPTLMLTLDRPPVTIPRLSEAHSPAQPLPASGPEVK
jgi:anti-sigma factor RsiW